MWVKWVFLSLLALPLAEVLLFVAAWAQFGFFPTFLAAISTTLLGVLVLKGVGQGRAVATWRRSRGEMTSLLQSDKLIAGLAGVLLVIPGFLTDLLGLLLLFPATSRWLRARVRLAAKPPRERPGERGTIDLSPQEWRHLPDSEDFRHNPKRG